NKLVGKETKTLPVLGRFVVITGLDGAGKSTLVNHLFSLYSRKFTVQKVHLGRPPVTLLTWPIRFILLVRAILRKSKKSDSSATGSIEDMSPIAALRYLALAYERNRLGNKILCWIARGHIVFSDRYPSNCFGKMDSPRICQNSSSAFVRWLAAIEVQLYATIPAPDLLVEVVVSYETAVKRNAERKKHNKESDQDLFLRYSNNANLTYAAKKCIKFENDMPLKEAVHILFNIVWPGQQKRSEEVR
ncbi:MAG: hypothetical protein AB3N18_04045, partial [Allomuricauda sp.]